MLYEETSGNKVQKRTVPFIFGIPIQLGKLEVDKGCKEKKLQRSLSTIVSHSFIILQFY